MTAWTTPKTWSSLEIVTFTMMNTYIRDNQLHIYERTIDLERAHNQRTSSVNTTSTSWVTVTGLNPSITKQQGAITDIRMMAQVSMLNIGGSEIAQFRFYNVTDAVALTQTYNIQNQTRDQFTMYGIAEDLAAGTYEIALQWQGAGTTPNLDIEVGDIWLEEVLAW